MQFTTLYSSGKVSNIPIRPSPSSSSSVPPTLFDPATGKPAVNQETKVPASTWLGLVSAVVVGGLRLCLIFVALQLVPMPVVHTLMSGSPILVMFLSHCMLRKDDQMTWVKMVSAVLLAAGVVLNSNPYHAIADAVRFINRSWKFNRSQFLTLFCLPQKRT